MFGEISRYVARFAQLGNSKVYHCTLLGQEGSFTQRIRTEIPVSRQVVQGEVAPKSSIHDSELLSGNNSRIVIPYQHFAVNKFYKRFRTLLKQSNY